MAYIYFAILLNNMDIFNISTDVVFVRNNIWQIESGMRENVFSCSKIGFTPVWLVWKQIVRITARHSI